MIMITTDLLPTVNITLSSESAQTVVMFLISNQISFTLNPAVYPGRAPVMHKKKERLMTEMPIADTLTIERQGIENGELSGGTKRGRTTIEAVYHKYIEENSEWALPSETEIAKEFGLTLPGFQNGFKTKYGKTFYQVYMYKKMKYAARLLQNGIKASQISKRLGYSQPIKFNKMFQKHYGMTPKKYQMRKRWESF
jgi:AraC-like DNA-binding protein